jgi:hypothetical protein
MVRAGASAAEVAKMVMSGRIHVHGMHFIELQVQLACNIHDLALAGHLQEAKHSMPFPCHVAELRRCVRLQLPEVARVLPASWCKVPKSTARRAASYSL